MFFEAMRPFRAFGSLSLVLLVTGTVLGQSGVNGPKFESASMRPDTTSLEQLMALALRGQAVRVSGADIDLRSDLASLIARAFGMETRNIEGPDLGLRQRVVIHAVMPQGSRIDQVPEMLRTFLQDKLHLVTHRVTRQAPGYFLEASGTPLKLDEPREMDRSVCSGWAKGYSDPISDPGGRMECTITTGERGPGRSSTVMISASPWGAFTRQLANNSQQMELFRTTMPQLAMALRAEAEIAAAGGEGKPAPYMPVIDRTGIGGEWDVVLGGERWWRLPVLDRNLGAPEGAAASNASDGIAALSAALEKIGLKIEKATVSMETLIVDQVDQVAPE
jgi:uncharacterized protein (TIGR03435 family)